MAIFSNVNVGTAPNDGTGDSLRTSFTKVNENFQDILAIWPNVSENEIFANITSTGISYFNLVEAETLSGNTLSSESGNINVTVSNVNISGGNLSVSGTITSTGTITAPTFSGNISGTTGTYTGTVTAPTFSGNITGTTVTLTGNITANTLIGNISGTTGIFTGNISGTSSNLLSINHIVRSPSGSSLNTPINGVGDAYEFVLNTTDSVGSIVAFTINAGTTVTATLNATIAAGLERTYMLFNPGPSISNIVLPFYPNRTNINNDTVEITGNTTAFVIVRTVSTDVGNVFVQVANI
jgi:hypothetical protein